jgi:hypothetical protein
MHWLTRWLAPVLLSATMLSAQTTYVRGRIANGSGGVTPPPPPALTIDQTSPLPQGAQTISYSFTFTASNGTPPYGWSIISGSPPSGLALDSVTGILSGVPANIQTSIFTVAVADSAGATNTKPFSLTIAGGSFYVELDWDAAPTAASYNVFRSVTSGGPYQLLASGITTLTYNDFTVANGATYFYVVTATNTAGNSGNSNEASAVIPAS